MKYSFTLATPPHFKFWRTVFSHGWCSLPPFRVDKEHPALTSILMLGNGSGVLVRLEEHNHLSINVSATSEVPLRQAEREEIRRLLRGCLRLDEDFNEFYAETRRHEKFQWISKAGAGRMLRSSTVFEDVVKMICTTNCSWALTEIMVNNLCGYFGKSFDGAGFSFPGPETIAGTTEKFLRKNVKSGYRSPYLLELSRRVADGELDLESWRNSDLPTPELYDAVRSVKGIGPYAAGNILKLLGRYDYLGLDSWCRGKFFEIHKKGRVSGDRVIEKFYASYGKWRGLFFWLDVTKEWYDHKFPF